MNKAILLNPREVIKKVNRIGFGRLVMEQTTSIGVPPRIASRMIKIMKIAASPAEYVRRKQIADRMLKNSKWRNFVPRQKGYALLTSETLSGTQDVIAACRLICESKSEAVADYIKHKPFFVNILEESEIEKYPQLIDFTVSMPVIQIVTDYLGQLPQLRGIGIFVSPINDLSKGSQLFHADQEDLRQLKFFIYIYDVDEGTGPFTFVPADISKQVRKNLRHETGRLTDEQVHSKCRPEDIISVTGPAGSGVVVDTANCLHFGSRARVKPRIAFMFHYTSYKEVLEIPKKRFPTERYASDSIRSMLFPPSREASEEDKSSFMNEMM